MNNTFFRPNMTGSKRRRLEAESTDVPENFLSLTDDKITVLGNHLYLTSDINAKSCHKLIIEMHKLESKILHKQKKRNEVNPLENAIKLLKELPKSEGEDEDDEEKEKLLKTLMALKKEKEIDYNNGCDENVIHLHIKSFGGSLFDCFSVIDKIKTCKVPVYSYIDGYAASAGTLISVVCNKRYMNKNSYMLIHQLSSGSRGQYRYLLDDSINNKVLMKHLIRIYLENTKIPKRKLEEMLRHDLWFGAEKCKELGLIDEIL